MPKQKDKMETHEFIANLEEILEDLDKLGEPYWRRAFALSTLLMDAEITDIERTEFPRLLWEAMHDTQGKCHEATQAVSALKQLVNFFVNFEDE